MSDETDFTGVSGGNNPVGASPNPPFYPPAAPPTGGYQPPPPPAGGYQPPPPPPGGYQTPPAGGYQQPPQPYVNAPSGSNPLGFDPKSLQNFDPKTVNPMDWGIMATGLFAFIFSTFSYYKYTVGGYSGTVSAWHGFFGWFAALVALAAGVILAVNLIAKISLPFPVRLAVLGGFALALLCTLLAFLVVPGNTGGAAAFGIKISKGHGIGYWLSLLIILGGTAMSYLRLTQTGGKLPGRP